MTPVRSGDENASQRGFTLIEVLVVLAIVAMAISLATPLLRGPSPQLRLATMTGRVVGALRATRAAAVARSQDMDFAVEASRGTFSSPVVSPEVPSAGVSVEIADAGARASSETATQAIRFFPDGSSTGGEVVIRTAGREARVRVEWLSGRARIVAE